VLDNLDQKILKLLQQNCRITTEDLGDKVGLSATACQRRIKKLKESGIIEKEIAVLNERALGDWITIIVNVAFKEGGTKKLKLFNELVLKTSEVQQCFYTVGECDYVLILKVKSMAAYEQLTQELFLNNPNIEKFNSIVAMEKIKTGLNIPL